MGEVTPMGRFPLGLQVRVLEGWVADLRGYLLEAIWAYECLEEERDRLRVLCVDRAHRVAELERRVTER